MKSVLSIFSCCRRPHHKHQMSFPKFKSDDVITQSHSQVPGIDALAADNFRHNKIQSGEDPRPAAEASKSKGCKKENEIEQSDILNKATIKSTCPMNETFLKDKSELLIPGDSSWILKEEKNSVLFTKQGLVKFIDEVMSLPDYSQFFNQKGLELWIRKAGSPLSAEFPVGKSKYTVKKSVFKQGHSLSEMVKLIYAPEHRVKWDRTLKSLTKIETQESAYTVRTWNHSPLFLVSERETIDKRFEFFLNGDYYCYSSGINENVN